MDLYSIYIHIPFCRHRCGYCDFNTFAGQEKKIPAYIDALSKEIDWISRSNFSQKTIHTIFLGGGTPSLVDVGLLGDLLEVIQSRFKMAEGLEITLEANPGTVTPDSLGGLRQVGFNRISFGMQSANPGELRLLERQHSVSDVVDAVRWSREAGFKNLNLDLIYGLPAQEMADWQNTIEVAISLQAEHLSLYALTIEEGTPMYRWERKGMIPSPDDDLAAEMYEWAGKRLARAGFYQYEISNWAVQRDGKLASCRHNLQYWRNQPYFGFGAGAHGSWPGLRMANEKSIAGYIQRCNERPDPHTAGLAVVESWGISRWDEMQETMMLGLRLTSEGVSRSSFFERFGEPFDALFANQIDRLCRNGLLEDDGECIRLTERGRLLGNQVFREFVGN